MAVHACAEDADDDVRESPRDRRHRRRHRLRVGPVDRQLAAAALGLGAALPARVEVPCSGVGSQRYSSSVSPSKRGRSWWVQCQAAWSSRTEVQSMGSVSWSWIDGAPHIGQLLSAEAARLDAMSSSSDGTGTAARVLRLLDLLQSRPVWSGTDLADRLARHDSQRAPRRRTAPRPRLPRQRRPRRGRRLPARAGRRLPPLLLDDSEAVAVAVCLRLAAGGTVEGLGEAAVRTLAKLDQVLPGRLRVQVEAIHEATVTLDSGVDRVDAATLLLLARACRETSASPSRMPARAVRANAASSPTASSPRDAGGTCSPTTSTVTTAHLPAGPHDRRAVTRLALQSS